MASWPDHSPFGNQKRFWGGPDCRLIAQTHQMGFLQFNKKNNPRPGF
jgi:hypothetical protein